MLNKTAKANLLRIARTYAKAKGLSLSTVSRMFHGKQRFFKDLKAGKCTVSLAKLDSMIEAFGKDWPEGVAWPIMKPIYMLPRPSKDVRPQKDLKSSTTSNL